MKVTFNEPKKMRRIEQLSMGQTFVYKREVYMKMGEYSNLNYSFIKNNPKEVVVDETVE